MTVLILMLFHVILMLENFTGEISVLKDFIHAPQMNFKYNLEVQAVITLFSHFENPISYSLDSRK